MSCFLKNSKILILLLFLEISFFVVNQVLAQTCPSQTQYSSNYAVLVGEVTDSGGENNVQAWFEWGTNSYLGNFTPQQYIYLSYLPYRFCYTLENLDSCKTYYYRAVVKNSQETAYGQVYSFVNKCQSQQNPLNVSCYVLPNPANVGSLVTFYGIVSGGDGPYSYQWSGACNSTSLNCQNKFLSPGNYYATLRVTSENETKYATCSVNINQAPPSSQTKSPFPISLNQAPVAIIAFSPEKISPGTIVTFSADKSYDPDGSITSYAWYINDQLVSNKIIFSRALASGSYRIKLVVTDNNNNINSKEILISVGRNIYLTRTITKTVTKTIPERTQIKYVSLSNLVDVLLDHSYKVKKCSSSNLQLTLINNTSVNRQINISLTGEIKDWFQPQKRNFILKPQDVQLVNWKVVVPCEIKENVYEFIFNIATPGREFEKKGFLEIEPAPNPFAFLLSFIKGVPIFRDILNGWLILILIIFIISYGIYRHFRKKLTTFNSSIIQKP